MTGNPTGNFFLSKITQINNVEQITVFIFHIISLCKRVSCRLRRGPTYLHGKKILNKHTNQFIFKITKSFCQPAIHTYFQPNVYKDLTVMKPASRCSPKRKGGKNLFPKAIESTPKFGRTVEQAVCQLHKLSILPESITGPAPVLSRLVFKWE